MKKRLLSAFLALCMMLTMAPAAFAVDSGAGAQAPNLTPGEASDDNVTINKSAERTGADTWEVTMTVDPKEKPLQVVPLDVVLVLDRSISMGWTVGGSQGHPDAGGGDSRLKIMQGAANTLIDQLVALDMPVQVGVASFAGSSRTEINLTSLDSADNVRRIKKEINRLDLASSTNLEAGLEKAEEILEMSQTGTDQVIIMLSDGEYNEGSNPTHKADDLKTAGVEIFTVGFANTSEGNETLKKVASEPVDKHFFEANDADQLVNAFTQIAYEITAMVNDPMGDYVKIIGTLSADINDMTDDTTDVSDQLQVVEDGGRLLWNPPEEDGLTADETLTITYTVQLKDELSALWSTENGGILNVPLNGNAKLQYQITGGKDTTNYELDFNVPSDIVNIAKLSVWNQYDDGALTPVSGAEDQYVIIYMDGSTGQEKFGWVAPGAAAGNYVYAGSTITEPDSTEAAVDEDGFYIPTASGEYKLIHHYSQKFDLTYDANGGTFADDRTKTETGLPSGSHTLNTSDAYKPTHEPVDGSDVVFIGWSTTRDTKIYTKDDAEPGTVTSVTIPDVLTVYALWGYDTNGNDKPDVTEDTYDLTYDANGGEFADGSDTKQETGLLEGKHALQNGTTGEFAATYEIADDTEIVFVGWSLEKADKVYSKDDDTTALIASLTDEVEIPQDKIVYAVWGYDANGNDTPDVLEGLGTLTYDATSGSFADNAPTASVYNLLPDTYTLWADETTPAGGNLPKHSNMAPPAGSVITDAAEVPVVLIGWTANAPADDKVYAAGEQYPALITTADVAEDQTTTVYAVWGYDENSDGIADALQIVITPADITIYTGGDTYEGVVDEVGTDSVSEGMPEPGYYFILPYELDDALGGQGNTADLTGKLHLHYENGSDIRAWNVELYNNAAGEANKVYGRYYIYRLVPDGHDHPVRLEINDGDEFVTSDEFDLSMVSELFRKYPMTLYTESVERKLVTAQIDPTGSGNWQDTNVEGIALGTGMLTIRGTNLNDPVSTIETAVTEEVAGITAVQPEGIVYTINGSDIPVLNPEEVMLLADTIVDGSQQTLKDAIISQAAGDDAIDITEDHQFDFSYLDLVDTSNGNAYVTANMPLEIYWPYPDGMDQDDEFYIAHFEGLNREFDASELDNMLNDPDVPVELHIYRADADEAQADLNLEKTEYGIKISTQSFSPFALIYEEPSGGGGGGSTTRYTLTYESNGGTEYNSERYARNTVVELDKTPIREGYTFTGWYADRELTDRITEVEMTSDKTVYAGWEATGVPDALNGDDHFAYIIGREDGLIHPNADITRAEVATIFFRLLKDDVRADNLSETNSFTDVSADKWYNTAISTMAKMGIINGDPDGAFRPDDSITRAEFAAIAARFDDAVYDGKDMFSDIASHWAQSEINTAASRGWITGYTNGTFRPNTDITRAEAMTLVNRVLNRLPEDTSDLLSGMISWPDNQDTTAWYYLAVQEATNSHDFERKSDGVHEKWTALNENEDWSRYEQ